MAGSDQSMISPAIFVSVALRKASFALLAILLLLIAFCPESEARRRHGPSPLDTLGEDPDQEFGWEILKQFRSLGISGDYRFRFQLMVMPKRESTRRISGVLLGTSGEGGPISRVDIALEESSIGDNGELIPAKVDRLLLQNGLFARAFEIPSDSVDGVPVVIDSDSYFEPIAGSDFTVFDLLMPYSYWQKFYYEGRTTLRGRPSHVFWLYPPEDDELMKTKVSGVRIFIDEEFSAVIQVEVYDPEKVHSKSVTIVDFKKVDGQWILSQVDVRNEKTRDKTRFKVVDAALNLELPEVVFTPQGLVDPMYGTDMAVREDFSEN